MRLLVIGGSDAGISAGLAARELDLGAEVTHHVMPTLDPELAASLAEHLRAHGVAVQHGTKVVAITKDDNHQLRVDTDAGPQHGDVVLVVAGVRPDTTLAADAGADLGTRGAIAVDRGMRTNLPDMYAAGDRVAGTNAVGGDAVFAGSLGTQAVKVFDLVAAGTGLRDPAARDAGFDPITVATIADDHKAYYPGATPIRIRITGDRRTGRLLGAQMLGSYRAEIAKRIDTYATAISYRAIVADVIDLDLSYTPPLGSPWDAVQVAATAWQRATIEHQIS